jgi:hypothetical protein
MAAPAIDSAAGGSDPAQSSKPARKLVRDPSPELRPTASTRPQPKRPSLSGADQNWPGRRCAFDFGMNRYSLAIRQVSASSNRF